MKGDGPGRFKRRIDRTEAAREYNKLVAALSARDSSKPPRSQATTYHLRPFQPHGLAKSEGAWSVRIFPGYVLDSHVRNEACVNGTPTDSAVWERTPTITGDDPENPGTDIEIPLDADDPPELGLPAIESWIYIYFETDEHGNIEPQEDDPDKIVTIVALAAETNSVHHEPEDENGTGERGYYYWQIAKTESNGESGDAERPLLIHEGMQSDMTWQEAFVLQNLDGSGQNVYKKFDCDEDALMLRTIFGRYGLADSAGDESIDLDFDAENVGTGEGVYLVAGGGNTDVKAEFRSIDEGTSPRNQIDVFAKDADTIGIRGNNKFGSISFIDCDDVEQCLLSWADGLVTSGSASPGTDWILRLGECPSTSPP